MSTFVAVSPTVDSHRDGPRFRLNAAYVNALAQTGLVPIVVPPLAELSLAARVLEPVQGLVLTGGVDIDPDLYGEDPHARTQPPSRVRDAWELALLDVARERSLPTFAICRGLQLVNVAMGGTLVQDIGSQRPASVKHDRTSERTKRVHDVEVESGSRLSQAIGTNKLAVNSVHHQCVRDVGRNVRITARSSDGVIEALEWPTEDWWMVAVQWHPEELARDREPWDRNLFEAFAVTLRAGAVVR